MPTQDKMTIQSEPEKKPYHTPQLVEHGTIQNMTLAGTGPGMEFFMGAMMA